MRGRLLLLLLLAGLAVSTTASPAGVSFPALGAKRVALCDVPPTCEHIDRIRVLGVLELPSPVIDGMRFSQLSGLAWDQDDDVLYALSDKGMLFGLRPQFRSGRLADVTLVSAARLIDPLTGKPVRWHRADSEGLDILNGRNGRRGDAELLISFEREARIARYRPDGTFIADVPLPDKLRDVRRYRGGNKMLEAVCMHPREGVLTAPEEPLDNETETARLYRMDGSSWSFPPSDGGIAGIECLPDGDVLVLERKLEVIGLHKRVTLRQLHLPAHTPPDTLLHAETVAVLDSDHGLNIDNFEGLARRDNRHFFMVSDNNDVFLQRTLLVYFEVAANNRR
jgi:hypothetical protein